MGKFIKKPFAIEAVELTKEMLAGEAELPKGVQLGEGDEDGLFFMDNALGLTHAEVGDFHVTGFEEETYFITRDIFQKTYLPFEEKKEEDQVEVKPGAAPKVKHGTGNPFGHKARP